MTKAFVGDMAYLSNMYPCRFKFNGQMFWTSEAYYQGMKFPTGSKEQLEIFAAANGFVAKRLARTYQSLIRPDWHDIKLTVMKRAVFEKFRQNPELAKLLILQQGDIVETNTWNDTFWGTCNGRGRNELGKILMRMRTWLIEQAKQ